MNYPCDEDGMAAEEAAGLADMEAEEYAQQCEWEAKKAQSKILNDIMDGLEELKWEFEEAQVCHEDHVQLYRMKLAGYVSKLKEIMGNR